MTTLAGNGISEFADGPGSGAEFKYPSGVVVDHAGKIYIADMGNSRIRLLK